MGVLLCLIIITGRIIIQKNRDEVEDRAKDEPKFHKSSTGETTITKGFSGDNIPEVEGGDIDLTTISNMSLPPKSEVSFWALNLYPFQGCFFMGLKDFKGCEFLNLKFPLAFKFF